MKYDLLPTNPAGQARALERQADSMKPHQGIRELLKNGFEAGATEVVLDYYTDPATKANLVRCTDNGTGMSEEVLRKRLATLYDTSKDDSLDGNYGVGAKVANVPLNPHGVTWASRTLEGEAMIRIIRVPAGYALERFEIEGNGMDNLAAPDDWMLARLGNDKTGTAVILHGKKSGHSTWRQNSSWNDLERYVSQRFWTLPAPVKIWHESNNSMVSVVPLSLVYGRTTESAGTVDLGNGTTAHWFVRPAPDARRTTSDRTSMIALLHEGELFGTDGSTRHRYGQFGISGASARARIALIIEPPSVKDDPEFGVRMNEMRDNLIRRRNQDMPWAEWGQTFADNMPAEVKALLQTLTPAFDNASIERLMRERFNPEWLKRLADSRKLSIVRGDEQVRVITDEFPCMPPLGGTGNEGNGAGRKPPARKTGEPDGSESGRKNPDFQLPRPVWRTAEEFENDGRIAVWLPVMNQVNLNQDHRAVREAIKRNQDENPLMSPTTVGDIVRNAFAMEIISKILHVMTMRGEEEWPDLELDKALSPEALTTALMGFCTIDSMVANGLADHLKNEAAA